MLASEKAAQCALLRRRASLTCTVQGIDSVTDGVMRHISDSQAGLQALTLRSGYALTPAGLRLLAPLANLALLSVGACPGISRATLEALTAGHARLALLGGGTCPLLRDTCDAVALAPEQGLLHAVPPCVRVM